jgi:hypothetical protein
MDSLQISTPTAEARFELRFVPLVGAHPPLAFDCDAAGAVDIDGLSERERRDYLFAHMLVGRDYASPTVRRVLRARAAAGAGAAR